MPSKQVQGVEDPFLLSAHAPNYWAKGWHAKRWMELAHGGPVPRDAISITLNSFWGRTQNQLHLHISCVRDDLRAFLRSLPDSIHDTWTAVPGGWQGHPYEVRKVFAETLDGENLFKDVARDRSDNMAQQGIAAVATQFGERHGFWLMRTQLDMKSLWHASIEGDVQDHACRVLAAK